MKGLRLRTSLRRLYLVGLILHVILLRPPVSLGWILPGSALVILGRILQIWASGHLDKINELRGPEGLAPTSSGPYARVRSPIAWSSYISDMGLGVVASAPVPMALWTVIYWWTAVRRIIRYEEPMLRRRCGEAYELYRQAVPRLIPSVRRWKDARDRPFSWRLLWISGETSRFLGAACLLGLVIGLRDPADQVWIIAGSLAIGMASLIIQSLEHRPHLGRRWVLRLLKERGT